MFRTVEQGWWIAEVVPNPDALLAAMETDIATADARVLARCESWVNLARALVEAAVAGAFVVDLGRPV